MEHVMLDLETMGNGSSAAIIAIGAVGFDVETGALGEEFYQVVDLASAVAAGGVIDASTVLWWMWQSEEARAEFKRPGVPISLALVQFTGWFLGCNGKFVWGNGASFDNVILAEAYRRLSLPIPWGYSNNRCFRTVKAQGPKPDMSNFAGTAHNALDDAKWQAEYMIRQHAMGDVYGYDLAATRS